MVHLKSSIIIALWAIIIVLASSSSSYVVAEDNFTTMSNSSTTTTLVPETTTATPLVVHCPAGSYCPSGLPSSAIPCPSGNFCPADSTESTPCSLGSYCPANSSSQEMCPEQFFCPDPAEKNECLAGFYCPQNSTSERPCAPGSYCPPMSGSPEPCPAASYCPTPTESPLPCPLGSYCPESSASPSPCQSVGSYCPANSTTETQCPAGSFCTTSSSKASCPQGAFCTEGSHTPALCDPGHFNPDNDSTASNDCRLCGFNEFSNSSGSDKCEPCQTGSVSFSQGASSCQTSFGECTSLTNVGGINLCSQFPTDCGICQGICVPPRYLGTKCDPTAFDETTCKGCANCTWNEPILIGAATQNVPYCVMSANPLACPSPLTCSSVNLEQEVQTQCIAAGCKYSAGVCSNDGCFFFFLNGFILQPLVLLIIGFGKDVVVLLLFGVFGDAVMRKVKQNILVPLKFKMSAGWDKKRIKVNLERTIYVNDDKARDHTSDKGENFERYCTRLMLTLFELPQNGENFKSVKRKVLDAVTFSMFSSGLWINIDDDGYDETTNDSAQQQQFDPTETSSNDEFENQAQQRLLHGAEKVYLDEDLVNNVMKLQSKVDETVVANATSVLYYASSRDTKVRAATSLNSYPSQLQQLYYLTGVILLVSTSFYSVVLNKTNQSNIQRLSSFSCVATPSNSSSPAPSDAPSTFAPQHNQTNETNITSMYPITVFTTTVDPATTATEVTLAPTSVPSTDNGSTSSTSTALHSKLKSTYLLLAFRLVNASTLATVMLLLVKTVRAIWASFGNRFQELDLPQRLPIMNLYTKRGTQILLVIYFGSVFPFAAAGVTYGITILPSLIVVAVAVVLTLVDAAVLALIRSSASQKHRRQLDSSQRQLEEDEQSLASVMTKERERIDARRSRTSSVEDESIASEEEQVNEDSESEFYFITERDVVDAKRQSVNNVAPRSLGQAFAVFLLTEELPTIILTITFQVTFNYLSLIEYRTSFGIGREMEVPEREYEARSLKCVVQLFTNDASGIINAMSSFFAFF